MPALSRTPVLAHNVPAAFGSGAFIGALGGSGAILTGGAQVVAGVVVGFGIGIVAALLGVAGGELLIPTLVLLFGVDIKLAGSLSLAVSLPTMVVGFARYSRDRSFAVLGQNLRFVLVMAAGSVTGSFIGGIDYPPGVGLTNGAGSGSACDSVPSSRGQPNGKCA